MKKGGVGGKVRIKRRWYEVRLESASHSSVTGDKESLLLIILRRCGGLQYLLVHSNHHLSKGSCKGGATVSTNGKWNHGTGNGTGSQNHLTNRSRASNINKNRIIISRQ